MFSKARVKEFFTEFPPLLVCNTLDSKEQRFEKAKKGVSDALILHLEDADLCTEAIGILSQHLLDCAAKIHPHMNKVFDRSAVHKRGSLRIDLPTAGLLVNEIIIQVTFTTPISDLYGKLRYFPVEETNVGAALASRERGKPTSHRKAKEYEDYSISLQEFSEKIVDQMLDRAEDFPVYGFQEVCMSDECFVSRLILLKDKNTAYVALKEVSGERTRRHFLSLLSKSESFKKYLEVKYEDT